MGAVLHVGDGSGEWVPVEEPYIIQEPHYVYKGKTHINQIQKLLYRGI